VSETLSKETLINVWKETYEKRPKHMQRDRWGEKRPTHIKIYVSLLKVYVCRTHDKRHVNMCEMHTCMKRDMSTCPTHTKKSYLKNPESLQLKKPRLSHTQSLCVCSWKCELHICTNTHNSLISLSFTFPPTPSPLSYPSDSLSCPSWLQLSL